MLYLLPSCFYCRFTDVSSPSGWQVPFRRCRDDDRTLNVAKLQSPLVDCKDCRNLFHVWPRPSLGFSVSHVFSRGFWATFILQVCRCRICQARGTRGGDPVEKPRSQPWWNDWTSLLQVVMTPFLQRYMAYMVSLGINFEQANVANSKVYDLYMFCTICANLTVLICILVIARTCQSIYIVPYTGSIIYYRYIQRILSI